MLIKLEPDLKEIKSQNEFYEKWKKDEPDDEWAQKNLNPIKSLDDVFGPYEDWIKELPDKYKKILDTIEDTVGVYITELNCEGFLERLATNKLVDAYDVPNNFFMKNYGVCDNASQAIEYYKSLISQKVINEEDTFVITLTPMFKKNQPEFGGWRWHKWGQYIGVQNPQYEYLYDEEKIDLVYVYTIHKMS